MIRSASFRVQSIPLTNGAVVLLGWKEDNERFDPDELVSLLFARHEASFFGSLIQTIYMDSMDQVLLPPEFVIPYLAEPEPNRLLRIQWDDLPLLLSGICRIYRSAMTEGRYLPSFEKMQAGRLGWELLLDEHEKREYDELLVQAKAHGFREPEAWFDRCAFAWMCGDSAFREVRSTIAAANECVSNKAVDYADEDEWLAAIGWKTELVPFVVCLQLCEPDEARGWRLELPLQAKYDASLLVQDDSEAPELWLSDIPAHVGRLSKSCIVWPLNWRVPSYPMSKL